jgi:hypothetical protein
MLTQHSPTRGFTASGVRGDETSKELAAVVAEELKMETENFETPQVRPPLHAAGSSIC